MQHVYHLYKSLENSTCGWKRKAAHFASGFNVQQQLIALIWLFNLKFVREPLLAPHFVLYFIGTSFKPKVLTVHMKTPYHNR